MKITIEIDGKDPIIIEDVIEYSMCGLHGKLMVTDFNGYYGSERLVGITYNHLRYLERQFDALRKKDKDGTTG